MKKLLIFLCAFGLFTACNNTPQEQPKKTSLDKPKINVPTKKDDVLVNKETLNEQLLQASEIGNLEKVKKLIKAGANVNYLRENDGTGWYCGEDYCDGADNLTEQYFEYDRNNGTPLMRAAYNGHLETVKLLINKGADVNIQNAAGTTALMKAAYKGHLEIVKFLIDNNANINLKEQHGATALIKGVAQGHTEIVKLLLSKGADVNVADAYNCEDNVCFHEPEGTSLESAVHHGNTEMVKLLLNNGADVNFHLDFKQPSCWWCGTALTRAVYTGNYEIVKLLIDKGANVNEQDSYGRTPLYIADDENYAEIAELLRQAGAFESKIDGIL